MKLLTKEVEKKLPALYANDGKADPMVKVKFFCPWNNWTWYATEGSWVDEDGLYDTEKAKTDPKDFLFFGIVHGHEVEAGYFSLKEMESVNGPAGLFIERDLHFSPVLSSKVRKGIE